MSKKLVGWCGVCHQYRPTSDKPDHYGACQRCLDKHGIRECETCNNLFVDRPRTRWCSLHCTPDSTRSRFIILERDKFKCIYCGKSSIEDGVKLHVDHVVPVIEGGQGRASNLVTACQKCNIRKHTKVFSSDVLERILDVIEKRNKEHSINPQRLITMR